MCGIVGEWSEDAGGLTRPEVFDELVAMMARRGPDDEGTWSDHKHCQLGFRRLSILDLTLNGHQPMVSANERHILVFNGELYNFRELATLLTSRGVQFRSTGDAEVVLYSLSEWGESALQRFNGMFAIAFYDRVARSLLLARDHAGVKPLYYSTTSRGVVFGSQYDQIMSHPWNSDAVPDSTGFQTYLQFGQALAPHAMLRNTFSLRPGECLRFTPHEAPNRDFFFRFPEQREADLKGSDAVDALDSAVTAAVGRCLTSDVPVGCFLSGGVDSPLVAAKMYELGGSAKAFTIGTAGDQHDESEDAQQYAIEIGHEFVHEELPPNRSLDLLDDVISASPDPFADISIFPTMLVSRLASEHLKVVLSGDGADELLWGYAPRYTAFLKKRNDFCRCVTARRFRWWAQCLMGKNKDLPFWESLSDWHEWKVSRVRSPLLKRLFPGLDSLAPSLHFQHTKRVFDTPAQWLRWNEYHVGMQTILSKVDRASMHNSLEVRVPLLDREVVDVCSRIGWRECLDTKKVIGKRPLRAVLRRSLKHHTGHKRGFRIDMCKWLRGALKPLLMDALLPIDDVFSFEIDKKVVRKLVHEHLAATRDHGRVLWTLLSLVLWDNRHYKSRLRWHNSCH